MPLLFPSLTISHIKSVSINQSLSLGNIDLEIVVVAEEVPESSNQGILL